MSSRVTWRDRALLGAVVLASLGACTRRGETLLVFAAASTSGPLEEIGRAFEKTSGHAVHFAFGSSSNLARQIAAGAPADVFLSADRAHMDALEKQGAVQAGDRIELLTNILVVVVPKGSLIQISDAADLLGVGRIALGEPASVPAGIYARQWLASRGLWDELVPHVVPTLDVRAALAAVASGAVAAGVVYATDASISEAVRVAYAVPRAEQPSIVYAVAGLARAKSPLAKPFVAFLRGPAARAVFTRYGFGVL